MMMTNTIKNLSKKSVVKTFFLIALSVLVSCEEDIEDQGILTITPAPIAAFTETTDASDWKIINFTDRSSNATSYAWDFGDGATSNLDEPSNTYQAAGTYTVTLTVSNELEDTDTVEKTIVVLNPSAPIVAFTALEDPNDWKTFSFSNGTIKANSYSWDFGDGTTSTLAEPSHTYSGDEDVKDYTVTLTATNDTSGDFTILEKIITVTNPDPIADPTKKVIVLNSTCDEYTVGEDPGKNTSDNADAWDMTPSSTVITDAGDEITSPYKALWSNGELDSWIEGQTKYTSSEQPGATGDGNKFAQSGIGVGGRGIKIYESGRRLYQVVEVEKNVIYGFTIDSRSEAEGINTEVYFLNTEITSEEGIDANGANDPSVDGYFLIDNDFNASKSSTSSDTFTTNNTYTFKATTDKIVIYIRSPKAISKETEVFFDNINIITPGFED